MCVKHLCMQASNDTAVCIDLAKYKFSPALPLHDHKSQDPMLLCKLGDTVQQYGILVYKFCGKFCYNPWLEGLPVGFCNVYANRYNGAFLPS